MTRRVHDGGPERLARLTRVDSRRGGGDWIGKRISHVAGDVEKEGGKRKMRGWKSGFETRDDGR